MPFSSIDRLATLYCFRPVHRIFRGSRRGGIPILMYHSIAEEQDNRVHPYFLTSCTPAIFALQMQFLHENGYRVLSLGEAVSGLDAREENSRPLAVITFDDGYQNFYTHAAPVLKQYGFTASVFLPTNYIGDSPISFKGEPCMTWNHVRELRAAGITFGSHTVTHPQLKTFSAADLSYEVGFSKQTLEDKLGEAVDSFCYPYAFPEADKDFKKRLGFLLQQSGYTHGVCTILGTATGQDDRFFLPRLPASSRDDLRFLQAKLEGDYNWLHSLQYAAKLAKGRLQ